MQDTVDPAAAPPRTQAQIIEDTRRSGVRPVPLQKGARGGRSYPYALWFNPAIYAARAAPPLPMPSRYR